MVGIHYVTDTDLTIERKRKGTGFEYVTSENKLVSQQERKRIEELMIPPAWEDVHICPDPTGHIQAIGSDAKGRKQYIYHPDWVIHNQTHKFGSMRQFGESLPTLRETVRAHMREHELTRDRVLATVIWLLEHTFVRVGNVTYARQNHSYGLTTLREKHVEIDGNKISFSFKGKSGVYHELDITHPRVVKTIKACIDLPGYEVFQYLDTDGNRRVIDSKEVNEYLHDVTGGDFSAKDFRTWGGSVLAGGTLYELGSADSETDSKKNISEAVKEVSDHLRNTKTVCRKYYIHPIIIESYEKDLLVPHFEKAYRQKVNPESFSKEEHAFLSLL